MSVGHRLHSRHPRTMGARLPSTMLVVLGLLALAACASDTPPEASAQPQERAQPPAVSAPPPGTPLAKVEVGMNDEKVREILGRPSHQNSYQTFKAWIPFYPGGDERRYEWRYPGEGRVTFNQNLYSGDLQVIQVHYDPGP